MIPEQDILQSQFPDVLEKIEQDRARIAELEALFAAANAVSDEEDADEEEETEEDDATGVVPKAKVKRLKDEKKELNAEIKRTKKQVKEMRKQADALRASGDDSKSNELRAEASDMESEALAHYERAQAIDVELARHTALEKELKTLKANIRESERQKDELVDAARAKISEVEARQLILERLQRLLSEQYDGYLRRRQRELMQRQIPNGSFTRWTAVISRSSTKPPEFRASIAIIFTASRSTRPRFPSNGRSRRS